ncbi:nuclear transport factor 2 family protein [Shimia sagamensis]|uniref:Predicted SnoaL-like aldol condensation-catalyzing enzyme n=1 Tax=Shimia sagamensis TaxID=1566352 RepID=A0ABY1NYB5_9RHOB|nr:nuclear transport factor 2 family protein [Shimia sagamensis]SMP20484.1 Predicted SnoaL-like aldol condensation-catalyzing enzyme [Shimia sagamensis]
MKNYTPQFVALVKKCLREAQPRTTLEAYISENFVDHNIGGGKEELFAYLERVLSDRNFREVRVVRALQEDNFVFLHLHFGTADGSGQKVSTDFFKLDENGHVTDHWGVQQVDSIRNPSGRSKIGGPALPKEHDKVETNKALIEEFMDQCVIGRDTRSMPDYVNIDFVIEHSPNYEDGWESFQTFFEQDSCPLVYHERVLTVAEGDFVAVLSRGSSEGAPLNMVDIFRMKNDQIVEHWDNSEPVQPKME